MKRVQTLNKQLMLDFDQLSSTLFELGNVFSKLYSESLDFSNSVNTDKFQSLSDIYVNMNNFMVSWGLFFNLRIKRRIYKFNYKGNYFSGQMRNIQESMNVFFSYEKKYNIEMRIVIISFIKIKIFFQLLSQRNKSADEYTVAIGKLESLMKEENGLPNIIRNSFKSFGAGKNFILDALENGLKIKDKFAYYNQGIYDELSKCLQDTLRRFSDNFIKFGRSQSVSIMEVYFLIFFFYVKLKFKASCNTCRFIMQF